LPRLIFWGREETKQREREREREREEGGGEEGLKANFN
jgi:hypothetical protein